ncbi:glycosyltransferase [Stutzerimonas nitrititolerans]|uniref:glycosyltransferase n=1 Tax=Stutzerimonas nitrititolerans TaxID=2482751 RepID=UPI0028A5A53E|nr:glycosyltransferase [Stutzerimonas nitrititolerans]
MTDWTLIAGGRCPGQPWRVGIAGFAFKNQQVFLLSDEDWEHLATLAPLEPLIAYGKGNGLSFERIMPGDTPALDGVLLFTPGWKGQPLVSLPEGVRRYIALSGAKLRSELADESLFAKLFLPIDLPPYGERLIYLNQHVLRDPACSPDAWAVEKDAHDKDHSRSYSRSADFWIQRITTAIASDAADQRSVRPLLSVVIPTYNHGCFLRQSVQSVLDQGVDDIEILVLDNASTDETPEVMASLVLDQRVRYMRNRYNYGPGFNWGNGLQVASGRYVTFLSADDYFNPGHLARLLSVLQTHPNISVGYTGITWVDSDGQPLNQPRHPGYYSSDYVGGRNEVADLLIHDNYMAPSAVIFNRQALRATWVPVRNGGAGDWDMAIQMAEQYPDFAYIDMPGVSYRWHGAQHSQQHFYTSTAPLADHLSIVEGVFARNSQHHLKGREREVAAHIEQRLARYPGELFSPLGDRARALMERLEALAQFNEAPLFSIVLTTYNRPALLKDALASIDSQILRDFEVVLVNDHGDPVEGLLEHFGFPITYLRQGRNQGPAAARNAAHHLARGHYLVYLDDDDLFLPEHLQTLAGALGAHPEKVVYSDALFIAERIEGKSRHVLGEEQRYPHDVYSHERLLVDNYIPVNTFAWPRSLIGEIGGFDERLSGLEDWDFLLRLAAKVPFHHVRRDTVQVRMRVDGDERRSQQAFKDYPALYRDIYSRHSDQGDERVRIERAAKLKAMDSAAGARRTVESWLAMRTLSPVQQRLVEERLQQQGQGPSFGVLILDMHGNDGKLSKTLESLRQLQNIASNVQPMVLTVAQAPVEAFSGRVIRVATDNWIVSLNEVLRIAEFGWVTLIHAGDEFTVNGLLMAGLELLSAPDCRAVYCDEMYRQTDGSLGAALRPAFNLDYLLSFPAGMAHHWLFRREVLVEAGGFDSDFSDALEFELILRLINAGGLAGLGHIAEPLLITDAPTLTNVEDEQRAIIKHLQERGYQQAQVLSTQPGRYQIHYGHAMQPMVSLLIMAGDQLARLQRCVESLLEVTRYPHYELLLIESDPSARDVHDWLNALEGLGEARLRVVWPTPAQASFAAAHNLASTQAKGDYLLLLSPDAAAIDGAWLDELVNHAVRPEVGAVGAKLLSADGKVRHAGLILGLEGTVGRSFLGESLEAPGYMQRLQVDQNYSALSGECLMLCKELFIEAGGFDEGPLSARWGDVDLCLRLQQAGYMNVWTPRAQLLVDTSAGSEPAPADEDTLFAKWLPQLARDPAYNPGFSLQEKGGFKLAPIELSWRPLQSWRPLPTVLAHPADSAGCGHYRIMQPHRALHERGMIDGELAPLLLSVVDLERYDPDAIILQRQITDERLESMRRMRSFSRAFKVYELDDYLPNLPLKSVHRQDMPRDILKSLRRGFSLVDRLVVSTEALADAYAGMHGDIRVVGNRLPSNWWGGLKSKRRIGALPRVGWAGGISHTGDLDLIADVVKELAGEVEWVFFGMCPDRLRPYISEFHPGVQIDNYPQALARLNLDLALAPVEQNLFNECKSNLRLLEYGACGFPVICSDVRCYQGDALPVTRVKNRFRDWVDAIRSHINDLDAAARAGDDLRAAVLGGWMLEGENLEAWRKAWLPG